MHTIKSYETRVTLLDKAGNKYLYASKSKALNDLGEKFIRSVGKQFKTFTHCQHIYLGDGEYKLGNPEYDISEFIMRDDNGEPLTIVDFQELINAKRKPYIPYPYRRWMTYNGNNPVPGTGRGHAHRGTYYRNPRIISELKNSQYIDFDEPIFRPDHQKKRSVFAWDDFPRDDYKNRNWKRYRNTQYKILNKQTEFSS